MRTPHCVNNLGAFDLAFIKQTDNFVLNAHGACHFLDAVLCCVWPTVVGCECLATRMPPYSCFRVPVPLILAAASVLTARAAAVHDVISFNCVLLTWAPCCTFHGLHSNAGVTVGAFVIDGGDLHRPVFCFRQTDDFAEYTWCLVAVLCRVPLTL